MRALITLRRAVKFEDVDVARVVFFARFLAYAHEAMEHFFDAADGHYAGMVMDRGIGFPAVKAEIAYHAPLRYGDVVEIDTTTVRVGGRSATLRYRFRRQDGVLAAEVLHTVVVSDLGPLKSIEMPADIRAVLEAHLETPPPAVPLARSSRELATSAARRRSKHDEAAAFQIGDRRSRIRAADDRLGQRLPRAVAPALTVVEKGRELGQQEVSLLDDSVRHEEHVPGLQRRRPRGVEHLEARVTNAGGEMALEIAAERAA